MLSPSSPKAKRPKNVRKTGAAASAFLYLFALRSPESTVTANCFAIGWLRSMSATGDVNSNCLVRSKSKRRFQFKSSIATAPRLSGADRFYLR